MKFTSKDFLSLFISLVVFQLVAFIAWYFFDYNIFVPMLAGAVGAFIGGRAYPKKIQKQ